MSINTLAEILKKTTKVDRLLLVMFVLGTMLSGVSLFRGIRNGGQTQIEYLDSVDKATDKIQDLKIMVDIEGAVISPGVYQLPIGSRVKDVLVLSGGYSEDADRSYCEKNLNLAQEIKDGQKIYIPSISNTPLDSGYPEATDGVKKVNVNTATVAELDTLWGVGQVRAETIVKNRPYNSTEELVSKGGMSQQLYDKNKDAITLF